MKPSERMEALFKASMERYKDCTIDDKQIATLSNVLMGEVGKILDEMRVEIDELKNNNQNK